MKQKCGKRNIKQGNPSLYKHFRNNTILAAFPGIGCRNPEHKWSGPLMVFPSISQFPGWLPLEDLLKGLWLITGFIDALDFSSSDTCGSFVTKESWWTARMRPSKFFFLFLLHCWYLCFKNINCFRFGKRGLVLRVRFYIFAFGRKREINPSGYSFCILLWNLAYFGLHQCLESTVVTLIH